MNLDLAVVADEAELAKFVHEKADTGAGRPDHLCERLLADLRRDRLRGAILSKMAQKKKKTREPLLAGIEELVDQIFFDAAVSTQKIRHEQLGKFRFAL